MNSTVGRVGRVVSQVLPRKSEKSVKIGTDDWNTILIDHNRTPNIWGAILGRILGNRGGICRPYPSSSLSGVYSPPSRGQPLALVVSPWLGVSPNTIGPSGPMALVVSPWRPKTLVDFGIDKSSLEPQPRWPPYNLIWSVSPVKLLVDLLMLVSS